MENARDYRRGQQLLRELLPWARAEARKDGIGFEPRSALGRSTIAHVSEGNLDAILIYPAPKGGWHGDVVLKNVPPGVPNCFGTRVESPCRTRAEAEEAAKVVLVGLLHAAGKYGPTPDTTVFLLCGWSLTLPALPPTLAAIAPVNGYGSPLQASARVEQVLERLCPEGFNGDEMQTWSARKQAALLTVLMTATLSGLYAYPMRQHGAPS